MENCLYQGKTICTYDLKDKNGLYYEDMVLDWKQAAADRQLTCVECGANVYLAAGQVKEPYFAHYDLDDCEYGNGHETEELKKGKRLLYNLLKQSFPEGDIRARYHMNNGIYSTLYCRTEEESELAIDYRLQNNSLEKFRLRDAFYQENNICPVYVMGIRQEKDTRQIDWYQSLLQSSMGYLIFLDSRSESLTLKRSFAYRLGIERKFRYLIQTYPIIELKLSSKGQMLCDDFAIKCVEIEQQIKEEKLQYEQRQEQLRRLQEENQKYLDKEAERMEEYRRTVSSNEKDSDLNPVILEKCRKMIAEGNSHLVSRKYYDAIMAEPMQSEILHKRDC